MPGRLGVLSLRVAEPFSLRQVPINETCYKQAAPHLCDLHSLEGPRRHSKRRPHSPHHASRSHRPRVGKRSLGRNPGSL